MSACAVAIRNTSVRFARNCAMVVALAACATAQAQQGGRDFPARAVRFVVPFTPGAINDYVARLVAPRLAELWGQSVVVDNRAGAGTVIGTDIVAKSVPDGHTLLLASAAFAINVGLQPKLPFDTRRDFAPVTQIGTAPLVLVVNTQVPARTVAELVALAKSRPGGLSYGSTGSGGSAHLMGEMLKSMAGIDVVHVPYKGLAPALSDVMAGRLAFTFGSHLAVDGHVKAGRLRALAVTSRKRSAATPGLPTVAEAGYPDYDANAWWGIVVPRATHAAVVARLHADSVRVLETSEVRERLLAQAVEVVASRPEVFGRFITDEIERWGRVVKQSGAKPE